jgi:cyclase
VRVIPVLLLRGKGLVKTRGFKDPVYVGDPINAIRIFNEKEVDELMLLDIEATRLGKAPDLAMLRSVASECFMPFCYGGGVRSLATITQILKVGVEKVAMNTALFEAPAVVQEATKALGSSTIVGSIDYRKSLFGKPTAWTHAGQQNTKVEVVEAARRAEQLGVGELVVTAIDRDGEMSGYDVETLERIRAAVRVPVIACGGAGALSHFRDVIQRARVSAVAAGSFFVFVGRHRAVLITYPTQAQLEAEVFQ